MFSGFHYDRHIDRFVLECAANGEWEPWQPYEMMCEPVRCSKPEVTRGVIFTGYDPGADGIAR